MKFQVKVLSLLAAAALLLTGCEAFRTYAMQSAGINKTPATAVTSDTPEYVPEKKLPEPLIYEADGQVFMACGADTISLGKAENIIAEGTFNATLSDDNRYLFYIDYGSNVGTGTLMRAAADLSGTPEEVAEKVCSAQIFADGESVMYVAGIEDMTGDLYLKNGNGTQLIAQGVIPVEFGFSPGGECLYYIVQGNNGKVALYIKKGDESPSLVEECSGEPYINYGVNLDEISVLAADDKGRLLYRLGGEYDIQKIMFYSGETTETVCESGQPVKVFSPEEFVYTETPSRSGYTTLLRYKAPGSAPVTLSDSGYPVFAEENYYNQGDFSADDNDRRFIIVEQEIVDGVPTQNATLYEQQLGREKISIAQSDGYSYQLSPAGNCVVYSRENRQYASRKTESGWVEKQISSLQQTTISDRFDASGKYYYYNEPGLDNRNGGTLDRYSVADGSIKQLSWGIISLYVFGDTPHAIGLGRAVYRFDGDIAVETDEIADYILEGRGGIYLESYGTDEPAYDGTDNFDISFLYEGHNSSATPVCSKATNLRTSIIRYYPPINKDPSRAIQTLIKEAHLCQLMLEGEESGSKPSIPLEKASAIAKELSETPDEYNSEAFSKLYEGFTNYILWQQEKEGDKKEIYRLTAILDFNDAIDEYHTYTDD